MSILTASNPLILALVLSLYHVSKESYRILKLKKILICSTIGVFTLIFFRTFIFLNQIQSNNNYAIFIFTLQRAASYSSNSTTSNASPSIDKTRQLDCTVPYKTFLFVIQKEEQTPSNEAFGCANAMRYNSFSQYRLCLVLRACLGHSIIIFTQIGQVLPLSPGNNEY